MLQARLEEFSGGRRATLKDNVNLNGYALDYAVVDGDQVLCAVECRTGGMRNTKREAFDLVANLAMFTRCAESACLLLPESAETFSDAVKEVLERWQIERVTIGIVSEGPMHKLRLNNR